MRRKEEISKQGQTNNKARQHSTPNMYILVTVIIHVWYQRVVQLQVSTVLALGSISAVCWSCDSDVIVM